MVAPRQPCPTTTRTKSHVGGHPHYNGEAFKGRPKGHRRKPDVGRRRPDGREHEWAMATLCRHQEGHRALQDAGYIPAPEVALPRSLLITGPAGRSSVRVLRLALASASSLFSSPPISGISYPPIPLRPSLFLWSSIPPPRPQLHSSHCLLRHML
jgi:hypothetical protein